MNARRRAGFFTFGTSFFLVAPNFLLIAALVLTPAVSAQSTGSCDVPAVNDPSNGYRISVEPVEDSWWDNVEDPSLDLDTDLFTDFTVDNDTATAIGMRLVPGHMYTFCISIASNQDDPPLNPNSDIYLMTEPNWDRYKMYYGMRDDPYFFEAFDQLPVEWRDMDDWLPFRDVHAYEGVTYQEFSVAIDSSGAGFFGGGGGGGDSNGGGNGAGGGGGSGIISGSWTSTVSQQGQTGTGGGRSAVDNGDPDYLSGYGGSGQNGLVVLIFE